MVGKPKVLDLTDKKQKLLPDWQAYSRMFYETKVKDVVMEEWPAERARLLEKKANGEDIKDPPEAAPLWFRNKIVRAEFVIETDEVKKEVEAYRQSLPVTTAGEGSADAENAEGVTALARIK
jgi:hypothetical protein